MKSYYIFFISLLIPLSYLGQKIPLFDLSKSYGIIDSVIEVDSSLSEVFEKTDIGFYFWKETYYVDSNNRVEVTNLLDSVIVYEHFHNDFLKAKGELLESKTNYQLIPLFSEDGEKQLGFDTLYSLVPKGYWEFYENEYLKETGSFKNGLKEGGWFTIVNKSPFPKEATYLKKKTYNNDSLVNVKERYSFNEGQFKNSLANRWYFYFLPLSVNDSSEIYFFSKIPVEGNYRNKSYIEFMSDNIYNKKLMLSCGTSLKKNDQKGTWSINNNSTLQIDNDEVEVIFFNEKYLILKFNK